MHYSIHCLRCGAEVANAAATSCPLCGGSLGFRYDLTDIAWDDRYAAMWRYWRLLPADPARAVTLGEGRTPLLRSGLFDGVEVYWKNEAANPTGSHKDRALSVALTHAGAIGAERSLVVSAGSTGLSNAAYSARAGLPSVTLFARGAPAERVYPLSVLGSELIEAETDIDTLIALAESFSGKDGLYVASTTRSSNPYQAEGAKTIAYEIVEMLGHAPDWVVLPVGGGGTIGAVWRGFKEMRDLGFAGRAPRLAAVVPSSYDALAAAMEHGIEDWAGFSKLVYDSNIPTLLTKLAHAHPPDGIEALQAIRESKGAILAFSDPDAVEGSWQAGARDGLYIEPSSGILVPAVRRWIANGTIGKGETVVAIACGSGFRETFAFREARQIEPRRAKLADLAALILSKQPRAAQ